MFQIFWVFQTFCFILYEQIFQFSQELGGRRQFLLSSLFYCEKTEIKPFAHYLNPANLVSQFMILTS